MSLVSTEAGIMETMQVTGTKRMARYLAHQILVTTDANTITALINALNKFAKITQGRPLYKGEQDFSTYAKVINYKLKHNSAWDSKANGNGAFIDMTPYADAFLRYLDFYGERCI